MDEFIERNKGKVRTLAVSAAIFITGFASGYYYLDGNRSDSVLTIKESGESCTSLFKDGNACTIGQTDKKLSADGAVDKAPQPEAQGAVLGTSSAAADATKADTVIKAFAGSKNSTLYHTRDCQFVKRIKSENLVWFGSQQEAQAAGRKPHNCVK